MPLPLLKVARDAARDFLQRFPRSTAARGEIYHADGAVQEVVSQANGSSFVAKVIGSRPYRTVLAFDPRKKRWSATCNCPMAWECKHAYAALKELLVQSAPDDQAQASGTPAGTRSTPARPVSTLSGPLVSALGRDLTTDEEKYLQRISATWSRVRAQGGMFGRDFPPLGFTIPGFHGDRVPLWPSMPADEREFWLYLALFVEEHGGAVPEFMRPVSDPGPLRERVEKWRRTRQITRWQKLLAHLPEPGAEEVRELDLRLRFTADEAIVEARREGEPDFAPLKQPAFRALTARAPGACTPEATLLIQALAERADFGFPPTLGYDERDAALVLDQLLRIPWLERRLVAEDGTPLLHPAEPLRWELTPASEDKGDYRLRLVKPDGSPAGPFLLVVQGPPALYLTREAVWTGPPAEPHAVDPAEEARIPAAALESGNGVRFLRRLGVALPQRLREKVRTVEVKPVVRCEVAPTWPGAKEESCLVDVLAEPDDGSPAHSYTPEGWVARRNAEFHTDAHVYYERSAVAGVPALLAPLPLKWDEHRGHWHFKVTRKFPEIFSAWLRTLPPELTLDLRGELASFAKGTVAGSVRLEVEDAGVDWFDLRVVLDVAETELTKEELKLLLDARGGWVRLGGKGWRRLEFKMTEEEDEQLARLGLTGRELSSEPQRLHALQLADKAARKFLPPEQCERIERRATELQARVTPEIPAAIKGELRPYQREGFHFLAYLSTNRFGGILADDMGLGKTLQTLTWLAWLRETTAQSSSSKTEIPPSLVVCPKSVTDNWHVEAARFMPDLRVRVWQSNDVAMLPKQTASTDLHVINYAQLRSIGAKVAKIEFLAVILDEGQFIKNPSSNTAQIARGLRASHRLILSGTPIENRLLDLWSLMAFAMPGALSSRAEFAKLYDAKDDPYARRRLAARVRPFVLRRTKTQVAKDLPDRIEEDLHCTMEGEQKTLYRAELKRAQQMLLRMTTQAQLAKERFHVLTSLLRLRQICCHPRLVKPDSKAASAKLDALLEQLEPLMEEGQKVLVFSQFVEMLALLRDAITTREWPHFYLAGDTENRGDLVRGFQSHQGAAVFLISLKAGGFGLNLTAASYVVLFDPWWNPAVENQAIDRTHRIGQENKVIAYRLLIKDSIEEKIRSLQKTKRALADDVLGEEKFAQGLSLEDLRFLFAE